MHLKLPKGKYILAVSGGVDSMALLDRLRNLSGVELIVAHFNHGIRRDSQKDEKLVAEVAANYELLLEIGRAKLGKSSSEEAAREARYKFLRAVKEKHSAKSIVTAHHQDDLIETAFINLLRGTGRRGLTAIAQNPGIIRPLLNTPKKELIKYAKMHKLSWREDTTNKDPKYLRNYIRLNLVPNLSESQRHHLLSNINDLNRINPVLDNEIATLSQSLLEENKLKRQKFINLPSEVAKEVLIYWLRQNNIRQFDDKLIERLNILVKTARPGTKHDLLKGSKVDISRDFVLLSTGVN